MPRASELAEVSPINFDVGFSDFDVFPQAPPDPEEDDQAQAPPLETIVEAEASQDPDYNQGFGVLSRRSKQLLEHLHKRDTAGQSMVFEEIVKDDNRNVASVAFYEMLVLAQKDAIVLNQGDAGEFEGIAIEPAQHFYNY